MKVIRSGSVRRARSSFATRPTASEVARLEQRDRLHVVDPLARRAPCRGSRRCSERSRDDGSGRDEPQLRHLVELADVVRQLEERVEPGALARAEAVAELLEVAGEEAGRVAVALGCLVRERLGLARGRRGPRRRAPPRARAGPGAAASGTAQTANTIGRPVRSSHRRPRSWCGVGSSNADFSAASPISSFASAFSPSGTCVAPGRSTFVRTTDVADSGVTATVRISSSGTLETSWIESTAPSLETQRRGSRSSVSAWRAYSIDEIGAASSSPGDEAPVEVGRHAGDLLELGVDPEEDGRHVRVRDAAKADHASGPVVPFGRVPSTCCFRGPTSAPPDARRGYREMCRRVRDDSIDVRRHRRHHRRSSL